MMPAEEQQKRTPLLDPTPGRKKRLVEVLYRFLADKASLAELSGVGRTELVKLSECGHVKLKHGRLEEAEKIFQGLIVLDHRNPYFHAMMGSVHQRRERPVEAIVEYTTAVNLNPRDISSLVNRGEIYLRHRNYKKAAEDFRTAILLDQDGINLWANRARSLVIAIKRSMEADRNSVTRARVPRPG